MSTNPQLDRAGLPQRLPALVIGLAVVVLAGVVALTMWQVRGRIRDQIAGRDGEVLHAVALMHYAEDLEDGLVGPITNPGDQLSIVLKSAQLRGVLGVRLFDADGKFVESFPPYVTERNLAPKRWSTLKSLHSFSQFYPHVQMAGLFYPDKSAPTGDIPLLEVDVPLHNGDGPLAGIAEFLVEGHSIAAEFDRLDRHLALQAFTAFAAGGTILVVALAWVFRRLRRTHRMLAERTANLAHANQELAMAAKTSALGAVTAHLIHGLKNPLAGLQNFVASRSPTAETGEIADWQEAVASTRRMQAMINQVVNVLREEPAGTAYSVTIKELEETVRGRVQPLAREAGLGFTTVLQAEATLPNRDANLVALILVNLSENAIQSTPKGRSVELCAKLSGRRLVFTVRDEGHGFPADVPLFMPCRSFKGGSGIGLALCKQLAGHLGAELELTASTAAGCLFTLTLRDPLNSPKPDATELAAAR